MHFLVFIINFGPNSYPLKGNYPLAVRNISAVYPYIRFFISEELACCKGPGGGMVLMLEKLWFDVGSSVEAAVTQLRLVCASSALNYYMRGGS